MSKGRFIIIIVASLVVLGMGFSHVIEGMTIEKVGVITGFVHPESVAYDPETKVLYVGQFGSILKPTLKDGKGKIQVLSEPLGMLDGVAQLKDKSILVTDWKTKTLFIWQPDAGKKTLAEGFSGPADFCVIHQNKGPLVILPDLVSGNWKPF